MSSDSECQRQATAGPDWWRLPAGPGAFYSPAERVRAAGTGELAGAALAGDLAGGVDTAVAAPSVDVDLRRVGTALGVSDPHAAAGTELGTIAEAAGRHGLSAEPVGLQAMRIAVESVEPAALVPFWTSVAGYVPAERRAGGAGFGDRRFDATGETVLADPLRRCPPIAVRRTDKQRPLRQRIHIDISRPGGWSADGDAASRAGGRYLGGPFGVLFADADGNEVDVVPAGPVGTDEAAADWWAMFTAAVGYRVSGPARAAEFAGLVSDLAADSMALRVDLRPGVVVVDTGKDNWEIDGRFAALAEQVQGAAHSLGLSPDPSGLRFLQLGVDAVDIPLVREFWRTALDYRNDPRAGVTDIIDPRGFGPPIMFQHLEPADTARREQPNRTHVELFVPETVAAERVRAATATGGQIVSAPGEPTRGRRQNGPDARVDTGATGRYQTWRLLDPEGNELVICGCPPVS
ncbi:VOC family protein [Nakamurella aerolata]|uniref:Glyoxalase-like domain-containing protein n=1 Tax=Nakamurella aerolata TaxID=1656892 RepID=A0A849ABK3_9ACTN|nr:VOC family protein [Nakamurella aerolata]NNG37317.1 hypothetical protein [Nakamurella aerolata]